MPRRGRGGTRQGTPGTSYGNRTDLSAPKIAEYKGQPYGTRKQQVDSQRAVPVQTPPGATAVPGEAPPRTGPDPGSLGGLLDPTARPNEPITHGLSTGPGAGPEVLQHATGPDLATGCTRAPTCGR